MSEIMVKALDECVKCMEDTVKECCKEKVDQLLTAAMKLWNCVSDGDLPHIASDLYYAKDEDFLFQDFVNILEEQEDTLDWYESYAEDKKKALFEELKWYLDHDERYTCSNTEAIKSALSSMRYDAQRAKEEEDE